MPSPLWRAVAPLPTPALWLCVNTLGELRCTQLNKAAQQLLPEFATAEPLSQQLSPRHLVILSQALSQGVALDALRFFTARQRWLQLSLSPQAGGCGLALLSDISDLQSPPTDLADAHWLEILNWLPVGLEVDRENFQTLLLNRKFVELFGYTDADLPTLDEWWQHCYPDVAYRNTARAAWETAIAEARLYNIDMAPQEWRVRCKNGEYRDIQFHYRAIGDRHVHVYLDVSEQRRLEEELRQQATTDALTGLLTRRHFFEQGALRLQQAQRQGHPLCVLMLDLDHFKRINDRHGHAAGDLALQHAAGLLREGLRMPDLLARLGGEEFVLLLEHTDVEQAQQLAERLRQHLHQHPCPLPDGKALRLTASFGVARIQQGDSLDSLLSRADKAMYHAKELGRNRVMVELAASGNIEG
ncbi:GGDEF domain-containing protein [Leeia sp.]|uniref:GGDEF domain-containing protein n=1 Tax=Leeia sp. TaxID=2884678 RepID=UPI0035B49E47